MIWKREKQILDKYAIKGYWCQENLDRLVRVEEIAREKGCTVSQIALAWIMQQAFEVFPIVTISDKKRIEENIQAFNINLSREEIEFIAGEDRT